MTNCKEAGSLFQQYIDKELTADDIAKVEEHIKACEKCFGHMEFDQQFRTFMKNHASRLKLSDSTRKLIQDKLKSL